MNLESIAETVDKKTGIGKDNAMAATRVVLEQVKGKLPTLAQGYIDKLLQGGSEEAPGGAPTAAGMLGKVLGG
jgi:hypothetical protein